MKYCENCKKFFPKEDNFCPLCGRKLSVVKAKEEEEEKDVILEEYEYEDTFRDW